MRMRRRLFNLAAAVSLVLMVTTTGAWVRTVFGGDHLVLAPAGIMWSLHIFSGDGCLRLQLTYWPYEGVRPEGTYSYFREAVPGDFVGRPQSLSMLFSSYAFHFEHRSYAGRDHHYETWFPYWIALLILA